MNWCKSIDKNIIPEMTDQVRLLCPELCHVEVSVSNQVIRVVTRVKIPRTLRRAIESKVNEVGRVHFNNVKSWPVLFFSPALLPYTHHLEVRSPVYCSTLSTKAILDFEVTIDQLRGMRLAETEVVASAAPCDYVATFALGGVSMLSRVSHNAWRLVEPFNPLRYRAAITRFAERFHLLPALNWPDNHTGPNYLRNWLGSLRPNSRLLVFDTGFDGNGVNAAAKIIREAIQGGLPIEPSNIKVLGIVERRLPEKQQAFDGIIETPQGRPITFSVAFKHVPKVITEDWSDLLGYLRSKDRTAILPFRRVGLLRLARKGTGVLRVVGTSNIANVYDDFLNDTGDAQRIWMPQPREAVVRTTKKLLDAAGSIETNDIKAAQDWGFFDRTRRDGLITGISKRNEKYLSQLQ